MNELENKLTDKQRILNIYDFYWSFQVFLLLAAKCDNVKRKKDVKIASVNWLKNYKMRPCVTADVHEELMWLARYIKRNGKTIDIIELINKILTTTEGFANER